MGLRSLSCCNRVWSIFIYIEYKSLETWDTVLLEFFNIVRTHQKFGLRQVIVIIVTKITQKPFFGWQAEIVKKAAAASAVNNTSWTLSEFAFLYFTPTLFDDPEPTSKAVVLNPVDSRTWLKTGNLVGSHTRNSISLLSCKLIIIIHSIALALI